MEMVQESSRRRIWLMSAYDILHESNLDEWCHPWRGVQCNIHVEGRIALLPYQQHLQRGSVIHIFARDDEAEAGSDDGDESEEEEDTALMQRRCGNYLVNGPP